MSNEVLQSDVEEAARLMVEADSRFVSFAVVVGCVIADVWLLFRNCFVVLLCDATMVAVVMRARLAHHIAYVHQHNDFPPLASEPVPKDLVRWRERPRTPVTEVQPLLHLMPGFANHTLARVR